jgi:heme-degrading monooxygenase HmoA
VIVRTWRGVAPDAARAGAYAAHLADDVFPRLRGISGHREARLLRRELPGGEVEVVVVTLWESLDAVRAFAGDAPEVAVVEPEARAVLARFDEHVTHHELALES